MVPFERFERQGVDVTQSMVMPIAPPRTHGHNQPSHRAMSRSNGLDNDPGPVIVHENAEFSKRILQDAHTKLRITETANPPPRVQRGLTRIPSRLRNEDNHERDPPQRRRGDKAVNLYQQPATAEYWTDSASPRGPDFTATTHDGEGIVEYTPSEHVSPLGSLSCDRRRNSDTVLR